jgi:hypothetical protein
MGVAQPPVQENTISALPRNGLWLWLRRNLLGAGDPRDTDKSLMSGQVTPIGVSPGMIV